MFGFILRPIRRLTSFNAAEATVISFIIASLIGGVILWKTEDGREVHAKQPVLIDVTVMAQADAAGLHGAPPQETHTFIKDIAYQGETFVDSWFTAVSALCVTGLTSTDFSQFTLPGQIVVLILIQMGGLGIIVFTSIFAITIARGISERSTFRAMLAGILDTEHHYIDRMIKHVVIYTLLFEGTATLIMGVYLQGYVDPAAINYINPWWWSLFHSVSAFNNAGFGLLNNNLVNFVHDPVINIVIATLIILGGLGYPVLIAMHMRLAKLVAMGGSQIEGALDQQVKGVIASKVQTRVAIIGTISLLLIGTLVMLAMEWNNPIMADASIAQKLLIAFFQSTSTRTAGFNTVDVGALGAATLFIYMLLMYIGTNPAGTGGGIKIPTVAVLMGYIVDWFKKPGEPVTIFKQKVSKFAVSHAIRLFFGSFIFLSVIAFSILIAEYKFLITPDPIFNFLKVLFEIVSAFGTVGMSMGFVSGATSFAAILTPFSKILLIFTMLFGRLGLLTILAALPWKRKYIDHPPSNDFEGAQRIQIG